MTLLYLHQSMIRKGKGKSTLLGKIQYFMNNFTPQNPKNPKSLTCFKGPMISIYQPSSHPITDANFIFYYPAL